MKKIILLLLLCFAASPAWSQEIYVNGGQQEDRVTHDKAATWSVSYLQGLGEHLAVGLMYLNEGHVPDNHRDGYAPQLWFRTNVLHRQLSLSAGIGPYLYFDTESTDRNDSYDAHGWGAMYSLALTWYTDSRFLFQIRGNYIDAVNSYNSFALMGGIGYQLDAPAAEGPLDTAPKERTSTTGNELSLLAGDAVLNRSQSRHTFATAVEYRRGISPHFDVTAQLMDEDSDRDERYGAAAQLWAVRTYFRDRLSFGIGVGPYLAHDKDRGPSGSTCLNGIIGLTGAYHFTEHWMIRFTWDRVLTDYDHDADIFLAGLGYRF